MGRYIFEKGQQLKRIWRLSASIRKNPSLFLPGRIRKAIKIKKMLQSLGRNAKRIEKLIKMAFS